MYASSPTPTPTPYNMGGGGNASPTPIDMGGGGSNTTHTFELSGTAITSIPQHTDIYNMGTYDGSNYVGVYTFNGPSGSPAPNMYIGPSSGMYGSIGYIALVNGKWRLYNMYTNLPYQPNDEIAIIADTSDLTYYSSGVEINDISGAFDTNLIGGGASTPTPTTPWDGGQSTPTPTPSSSPSSLYGHHQHQHLMLELRLRLQVRIIMLHHHQHLMLVMRLQLQV